MTKEEFLHLAEKYQRDECSRSEEVILFEFCEKVQMKDLASTWNLSKEERVRIQLLKRIRKTINISNDRPKSISWAKRFGPVAAALIGFIIVAYIYLENTNAPITIPDNVITLELENGDVKIIKENGTILVHDKKGNVVGQQQGNQLVYYALDFEHELAYNTLKVPYGKRFEIQLSDGTMVHLNAGSSLKYPIRFLKGEERKVFVMGEAFLHVAKDSIHPFIVRADELDVQVLGTKFNVHSYPEDPTSEIVLVEGSVKLYAKRDGSESGEEATLLEPGHKAIFDRRWKDVEINPVITGIYTSWRKGELVFRNMTFENILKKLERHYDLTIVNKNTALSRKKFNASFGNNEPFENVLAELKEVYGIDFSKEKRKITIY